MISEEDLFEIFSDSHFMQTHRISPDEIDDLITLVVTELTNDDRFHNLLSQQARIEDSMSNLIGNVINNIVKEPAKQPACRVETAWYEIPSSSEETLNYFSRSN